jgi:hypothetical protein
MQTTTPQCVDPLLEAFLSASTSSEAERTLERILTEHVEPVLLRIVHGKISGVARDAAEDVAGGVRLQIVARLRRLRAAPLERSIGDLRSYVAALAFRACDGHFSRQFPQRRKLRNGVRYALAGNSEFALWEDASGEWLCGWRKWRDASSATAEARRRSLALRDSPTAFATAAVTRGRRSPKALSEALRALFDWAGGPVTLDATVTAVAVLWGVADERPAYRSEATSDRNRPLEIADPRDLSGDVERRIYLERLWAEIQLLPVRQRRALLLNLRDAQGCGAIDYLILTGVTNFAAIAAALDLTDTELAGLWKSLPLEDAEIAKLLGLTRQQVINLRKSARERLARRLRSFQRP